MCLPIGRAAWLSEGCTAPTAGGGDDQLQWRSAMNRNFMDKFLDCVLVVTMILAVIGLALLIIGSGMLLFQS